MRVCIVTTFFGAHSFGWDAAYAVGLPDERRTGRDGDWRAQARRKSSLSRRNDAN